MIEVLIGLISAGTLVVLYLAKRAYDIEMAERKLNHMEELARLVVGARITIDGKEKVDIDKAVRSLGAMAKSKGIHLTDSQLMMFALYALSKEGGQIDESI